MGRTDDGQLDAVVQAWLTERFAAHLRRPVEEIDTERPFADYGLDSVVAMSISVDIEDRYGIAIDAGEMWDRPTVAAMSRLVADRLTERDPASASRAAAYGGEAGV